MGSEGWRKEIKGDKFHQEFEKKKDMKGIKHKKVKEF